MKVIQLIDTLRSGGAERMAINILMTLEKHGIDSHLFVSRDSGLLISAVDSSEKIQIFDKKSFFDFPAFFSLFQAFKRINPDVLHAHSTSLFWATFLKILFPKVKLIWHDHYGLSDELYLNSKRPERFLIFMVNGIITVNAKLKEWWIATSNVDPKRVVLIPNFPFLNKEIIRNTDQGNSYNLLCLANFRRQKDHLTLLKALQLVLSKSASDFTLYLVGDMDLDTEYTQEVRDLAATLGVAEKVNFHGPTDSVESFLELADIGILSSVSEGLPVSLLEYGLSGLPTVVTDVGDCSTVLQAGKFGKLVSPSNFEELFEAILGISSNLEPEREKATRFKAHVESNYGGEGFVGRYLSFIEDIK